jgi:hypothetical protein
MEDCRLLLKNAVDIKLKSSLQHFHDAMALVDASCFWGLSVRAEAPNLISPNLSRFLVQFSSWATWLDD